MAKKKTHGDVLDVSAKDLEAAVATAQKLLDEVTSALPELTTLDPDERAHSNGRLRDDEPEAMTSILDASEVEPALFRELASRDSGQNDAVWETQPTRDALAKRAALAALADQVATLSQALQDTLLDLGTRARAVTMPAYGIAKAHAAGNKALGSKLAPAIKFYGAPAGLRAKRAKRAKKKNAKKQPVQ